MLSADLFWVWNAQMRMRDDEERAEFKPGDRIGGHSNPLLRRAERAVVRGLAAEYGKGQQVQMTRPDSIEIGVSGVVVTIRLEDEA